MKQLIDKSALVAEIKKAIDEPAPSHDQQCPWEDGYYCGLYKVESILDTIEVKGVDLEKEIEEHVVDMPMSEFTHDGEVDDYWDWAREEFRHFFELGLKAQENNMTEIKAGNCYMCLKDRRGYDSFTKGKIYVSLYDNALINDNRIEVKVMPSDCFRIATNSEIKAQKGE